LGANIEDLIARMKTFSYRPKPVKRVLIPKANGKKRPLGIPSVEDKIVQMGITKILQAIFEVNFLDLSYGFRPKRNCHQALNAVDKMIMKSPVNHNVLDLWFEKVEKHKFGCYMGMVRYCDDFVICVQRKDAANQLLQDLTRRLEKFGLELSLEKTRIVQSWDKELTEMSARVDEAKQAVERKDNQARQDQGVVGTSSSDAQGRRVSQINLYIKMPTRNRSLRRYFLKQREP